ncbi:MAG: hypothetical protein Q7J36_11045 [Thiobacillus sp.]|nr:hypothetical protein [Thiobacillus sp.]
MKIQISRLSPHQNGKVFGVLSALVSLVFVIPMALVFSFMPPGVDANGNVVNQPSAAFFLVFPIVYLVMGYIMTVAGCALYNLMFKYLGGIEYESRDQ